MDVLLKYANTIHQTIDWWNNNRVRVIKFGDYVDVESRNLRKSNNDMSMYVGWRLMLH